MKQFEINLELANNDDVVMADLGHIDPATVRSKSVRASLNAENMDMILPRALAKELGLPPRKLKAKMRGANGRWRVRSIVGRIHVRLLDRDGIFNAIVEPAAKTVVIGWMVMNVLDLVVDKDTGELLPRDPRFVTAEL